MFETKILHKEIEPEVVEESSEIMHKEEALMRLKTFLLLDNKSHLKILSRLLIKVPEKAINLDNMTEGFTDLSLNVEKVDGVYFIHPVYESDETLLDHETFLKIVNRLIDLFGEHTIKALDKFNTAKQ